MRKHVNQIIIRKPKMKRVNRNTLSKSERKKVEIIEKRYKLTAQRRKKRKKKV